MEKISVLMSTYREPENWLRESIESILQQTYSNIEFIIIVDDPLNLELISVLDKYKKSDDRIHIFINEKNMGLVQSLNKGLMHCTGNYIARMDADDISKKDRLRHQIAYLKEKELDLIGCDYEIFNDDTTIRIVKGAYNHETCAKILEYESCIAHPSWFVKRDVYEKLNGYREIDACEDLDFLHRTVLNGFKVGNCTELLLRYRDNPNSISHKKAAKQQAITGLLVSAYRKKNIATLEQYFKFCASECFEKKCKMEARISSLDVTYKDATQNVFVRFKSLGLLILMPKYVVNKIVRKKIRWLKKKND